MERKDLNESIISKMYKLIKRDVLVIKNWSLYDKF